MAVVTFCYEPDKMARQWMFSVCAMKTKAIYLTTSLLLSASPFAFGDLAVPSTTDGIQLRYEDPGSNASLSVTHSISVAEHPSIADRSFLMEFELNNLPAEFAVTINQVKGSYTAHDMTQRLPASGLKGQSFSLLKTDDSRVLQRTDSDSKLQVGMGEMIGINYPVGLALLDILPVLPAGPVTVGSSWETVKDTRSLEGWAWAEGQLNSKHAVTAVDQLDGHTIVSVSSTAQARLANVQGGLDYSGEGELKRNSHWRFDASDGRLLSVSMEQETSGINTLPQGDIAVQQLTKVEYSTLQ